ncbi:MULTISPECIES: type I restriction endonuclease subunit R, EcoR124 family [Bacillus cereus group]|uniref:type I restriction endonuclease subunit R, EcoR124 family n=1 Tax=Bacillus cereus group TaxID=86661 RepID=UPI0022E79FF5|nr:MULTISPECIES: type I restriction endonuclease subunit R [Bacillus cereus group]MDA2593500.1 type I restriction endonuclease subunit R [Bacillus cereus group sp. Bc065]MED2901425.1 type I restriction endonuclease subunit R [Bacillus tropicus]
MGYQSEAQLEKHLVEQLQTQGYEAVQLSDYAAVLANFRKQLNKFNEKKLNGQPLTDKEFKRVLVATEDKSIYESAKILRDKLLIEREDGTELYLELMNTKQWCKNLFQVTTQTTMFGKYENRYDVTIFINGLPIVQIELKRRGLDFKEAFNQIQRYRRHSFQGLYHFLQIFVVSNGVDTKYFSNSDYDIQFGFTFFWSDEENNIITNLQDFTKAFLQPCHLAKMVSRYMIINDTDKALMVMRPYQVYAVEALVKRANETSNNGFIWHTTGSGKTLTSFKAGQILANEESIKKVFFLVDRQDLDSQTIAEFNKFEKGSVDRTDKTDELIKQIKNPMKRFIVTTIQKMSNAVKNPRYEKIMEPYKQEHVVFIIDECHRSQFGDMRKDIDHHFQNAQYFGFTGTPRFEENKSQDGRTTADLFEKCLHHYLIKDAIRDGNVLGFSVEYISTFQSKADEFDDTQVEGIDTDEVLRHPTRLNMITDHIIDNHNRRAKNKGYCGIFAVDSIQTLIKYYDLFKSKNHNLKIAGIYSFGVNEESDGTEEHSREALDRMIVDYNQMFGTDYSTDTWDRYFADVSKKMKQAQIDILLVVNMFLTGFDSKPLNTLYVDKNLQYHNLLQAYSRTNRVEKATKPYGNVVCYRNLKDQTDDTIRLFSKTDSVDDVLMQNYDAYLAKFKEALEGLKKVAASPEQVDTLQTEEDQREFIVAFKNVTKMLQRLQSFSDFEFDEDELQITEQSYEDYKSKYFKIHDSLKKEDPRKESILQDIDFELELMHTDRINVSYIMNLIANLTMDDEKTREQEIKLIKMELDHASDEKLRLKVELIHNFLDKIVPQLGTNVSILDEYSKYEEEVQEEEMNTFASEVGLEQSVLKEQVATYEYANIIEDSTIMDRLSGSFLKKNKAIKAIKSFIHEQVAKYGV